MSETEILVSENQMARGGIDTQITTAKAYPRNIKNCLEEARYMATYDQETAESCIFSVPRKMKNEKTGKYEDGFVKGESIRLAEILMCAWGNIQAGTRTVSNNGKKIIVEGAAWDLEKNNKVCSETERSITYKDGKTFNNDMQIMAANAASSIALRNAIFRIIPKAYVKSVYNDAVKAAVGDQKTLSTRINNLFDRFAKMGIQSQRILDYFEKNGKEEITAEEVVEMIGIGTSIKEKVISVDAAFIQEVAIASSQEVDELDERLNKNAPTNSVNNQSNEAWLKDNA